MPYRYINDFEGEMAKIQLKKIEESARRLNELIHPEDELESWVQSKLSVIEAHIHDVTKYMEYEIENIDKDEAESNFIDEQIKNEYKEPEKKMSIYKYEPSTFEEEMMEAIQIVGKHNWIKMTKEEKIMTTKKLKELGEIGHGGLEMTPEEIVSKYSYKKGGIS